MPKNKKILVIAAAAAAGMIIGAILGFAAAGPRMRFIEEENKFLMMWIENRHGAGWAERVSDWARHKAALRVKNRESAIPATE